MKNIMKLEQYLETLNTNENYIEGKDRYPELYAVAKQIANEVFVSIKDKTANVESEMPYKQQFVLEELIKILEYSV